MAFFFFTVSLSFSKAYPALLTWQGRHCCPRRGLQDTLSVWGEVCKCFMFWNFFSQHHSHGCQYRGSWDSSGGPGHHGHCADVCGPAHRRHHAHHRRGLVPVSMLGRPSSVLSQGPLCYSRAPGSLAYLPEGLHQEGQRACD